METGRTLQAGMQDEFDFEFSGDPVRNYTVQASTDLVNWADGTRPYLPLAPALTPSIS
jgi:hypothetical protein